MSELIIQLPDNGWFNMGCNVKPTDKTLCVIIHAFGNQSPGIMQFRKALAISR